MHLGRETITPEQQQIHVGYEGAIGDTGASFYVQGGPAIVAADGAENSTRFSGKAGVGIPV